MDIIFSATGGNVFNPEVLAYIQQVENHITGDSSYSKFCVRKSGSNACQKPRSILNFFSGNFSQQTIDTTVQYLSSPAVLNSVSFFVDKYFASTKKSSVTRLQIKVALPLAGYVNPADRETEQRKKVELHYPMHVACKM
jgi:hypothetical protein